MHSVIGGGAHSLLNGRFTPPDPGVTPAVGNIEPGELIAMAGLAEEFRKKYNVPGLSVAIARNGRLEYQQAFGQTDHNGVEPLETSSLFRIASISKPITSVAVFKLIEQGRLNPNTTIFGDGGVLGTEYGSRPYGSDLKRITVDQLLTHTSGGWGKEQGCPMFSNVFMSQREIISWTLDNRPLDHAPGSAYSYSNFGYCLLGRVIEKVSGQPYAKFVQDNVLEPSGITDMHIAGNSRYDRFPKEVVYYGQQGEDPYNLNVARMDSHGGWIASPTDLVRFTLQITGEGGGAALTEAGHGESDDKGDFGRAGPLPRVEH